MYDRTVYEMFFRRHPDAMLVFDVETLRIVDANDAALVQYGYTADELRERTLRDLRPTEDIPRLMEHLESAGNAPVNSGTWRHVRRNGEMLWVDIRSVPVDLGARRCRMVCARDVTDRWMMGPSGDRAAVGSTPIDRGADGEPESVEARLAAATDRLRYQEMLLRSAQRLLVAGSWQLDLTTGHLSWSPVVFEIFGRTPTDFGHDFASFLECVHPDDRELLLEAQRRNVVEGRPVDLVHRVVRPDGSIRWVREVAERIDLPQGPRFAGVVQDVTEALTLDQRARDAHELMRAAGRVARIGAWRVDRIDAGGRVHWTSETAWLHDEPDGWSPSPERALEYYLPAWRDVVRDAMERCFEHGAPFALTAEIETARRRRLWIRVMGRPAGGRDGIVQAVHGAVQDITELVEERDRATRLAARLEETLESISDAFLLVDSDWRVSITNRNAQRVLAMSRSDMLGRDLWALFPSMSGSRVERKLTDAAEARRAGSFHEYYPPTEAWLEGQILPVSDGLAIYFRDVTERRNAEREKRIHQERFRLIAQATNDVIWDWDRATNRVWWSDGVARHFGYELQDPWTDVTWWKERIHPDDRARVNESLRAYLDGGRARWSEEYRFACADGTWKTIVEQAYVIRGTGGQPIRMIGSLMDITERRAVDARLAQSQRLEAIGQLTGGVAHDFNNLLTVILGNADLLGEALGHIPELARLAEMTATAAERGAELTNRLLAFARQQPLDPRLTEINQLVAGMEGMLRRTLTANVDLRIACEHGVWQAEVDPSQVEAALLNLAINARDAMPRGGRITIETANVLLDGDCIANDTAMLSGPFVMISVQDTGLGIPAAELDRVFEPFYTTKATGKGSGLGLSMVYGFVRQSGGCVRIHSEVGRGTTVQLFFPRADGDVSVLPAYSDADEVRGGAERILVVEDDDNVRHHVTAHLERLGYSVREASDGPSALALLVGEPPFDLLFTDVVMPGGMNGRELADAALAHQPALKVLFTSGFSDNAITTQGRVPPGVQLLAKPYRRQDLARRVRRTLDGDS